MRRVGWLQARFEFETFGIAVRQVDVSKSIFHYLRIVLMYVHPYLWPLFNYLALRDRRTEQPGSSLAVPLGSMTAGEYFLLCLESVSGESPRAPKHAAWIDLCPVKVSGEAGLQGTSKAPLLPAYAICIVTKAHQSCPASFLS